MAYNYEVDGEGQPILRIKSEGSEEAEMLRMTPGAGVGGNPFPPQPPMVGPPPAAEASCEATVAMPEEDPAAQVIDCDADVQMTEASPAPPAEGSPPSVAGEEEAPPSVPIFTGSDEQSVAPAGSAAAINERARRHAAHIQEYHEAHLRFVEAERLLAATAPVGATPIAAHPMHHEVPCQQPKADGAGDREVVRTKAAPPLSTMMGGAPGAATPAAGGHPPGS